CVGLSGLFRLRLGSVINWIGPALSWSCASSGPPCAPSAVSDFVTPLLAGANAGRFEKILPKFCDVVAANLLRAADVGCAALAGASAPTPPPTAAAPTPTPIRPRKPRRLYRLAAPLAIP